LAERLGDNRSGGLVAQQPPGFLVLAIAGRDARGDVHAAADRGCDGACPVLLDPLQLQLRDQGQDPDREPTHRRRTVEVVLNRHQPSPCVSEPPDRGQRINRRAGETIKPRNNDPAALTALTPLQRQLKQRPLQLRPRLVDLFSPRNDLDLMQLRPRRDLLPLHLRRNERLTLTTATTADPDIAVRGLGFAHGGRLMDKINVHKQPDGYRAELIDRSGK
jgi:hypothetical protein